MWGTKWLRQAGYSEETTLEVSRQVPPSVWLWNLTSVPGGAEVTAGKREPGAPAVPDRILCVEERDDGRGQLLVKSFESQATGLQPRPPDERAGSTASGAGVISCVSAPADPKDHRRVLLRTTLCAFSGRITEIRAAAAVIAS